MIYGPVTMADVDNGSPMDRARFIRGVPYWEQEYKGGETMTEKRVSRAEVEDALDALHMRGREYNDMEGELLDELFPSPPKSEYEKALASCDLYELPNTAHRRHIWNAAIEAAENRLCALGLNIPGREIRKLKVS